MPSDPNTAEDAYEAFPDAIELPVALIAKCLDHPSVYMGGPSRDSVRRAERVWQELKKWGYVRDGR
jgi:hypothetical protein